MSPHLTVQFPTTFVMQRANLTPQPAPSPIDPFAGHVAMSHGELAIRAVELFEAEKAGRDVTRELDELISGWEAFR